MYNNKSIHILFVRRHGCLFARVCLVPSVKMDRRRLSFVVPTLQYVGLRGAAQRSF